MLNNNDVSAMLPVGDVNEAKKFYGETLGLNEGESDPMGAGTYYHSGNTKVMIYQSKYAGTNQGTAANWEVENIAAVVKELAGKGIKFEHYDFPGSSLEGDVHVMGEIRAAWFKDPAGNILGITQS